MTRRGLALAAVSLALGPPAAARLSTTVVQSGRAFSVAQVALRRGDSIRFENADGFIHQIYTESDGFAFTSDEQPPGTTIVVVFPVPGRFTIRCDIHPRMALPVMVE